LAGTPGTIVNFSPWNCPGTKIGPAWTGAASPVDALASAQTKLEQIPGGLSF